LSSLEAKTVIRKAIQIALFLAIAASCVFAQITGSGPILGTPTPSDPGSDSKAAQGPTPFGSGDQAPTGYAGETAPQNVLSVSMGSEAAYDTVPLNTNQGIGGDETFTVGPRLSLVEGRKHVNVAVDYLPSVLLYRRFSQFDAFNQSLEFAANIQVSSRLALRLRNSSSYISTPTGTFEPRSNTEYVAPLGSPTNLNLAALVPQARRLDENARLDAIYQITGRSYIDLFGNFKEYKFSQEASHTTPLYNAEGGGSGAEYAYRFTRNTTIALLYQFQNLTFGSTARMAAHSLLFSYAQQLSPTVSVTAFVGPQFTRDHDTFAVELPFPSGQITVTAHAVFSSWSPGFGGTLAKQARNTVFQVSGQRLVGEGGGFLRATASTDGSLNIRHRLTARSEVTGSVDYAQYSALTIGSFQSRIRYARAGFGFERTLSEKLTARLEYNYLRQRGTGKVPLVADLDRSRISLGIFYQIGSVPLGR
jgi:hypothetical protein